MHEIARARQIVWKLLLAEHVLRYKPLVVRILDKRGLNVLGTDITKFRQQVNKSTEYGRKHACNEVSMHLVYFPPFQSLSNIHFKTFPINWIKKLEKIHVGSETN